MHAVYSNKFIKPVIKPIINSKIISGNRSMDYLGLYGFCGSDKFKTELECEHYHNRVAELTFNYIVNRHE